MTDPTIPLFPEEIIDMILDISINPSTYYTICLINHRWHDIACAKKNIPDETTVIIHQ